mmetsp:Transcript_8353/g.21543  ORF Transcript_8353/g.21543 Transcript_8353/m.21543 type:complete len:274 (-) Transcript_8353:253-1074(-)
MKIGKSKRALLHSRNEGRGGRNNWWSGLWKGSNLSQEKFLADEISFLEDLSAQVYADLDSMHKKAEMHASISSRRFVGVLRTIIGLVLSVFCVGRMISIVFRMVVRDVWGRIHDGPSLQEQGTKAFAFFMGSSVHEFSNKAVLTNWISLVLVSITMFGSFGAFVRDIRKLAKVVNVIGRGVDATSSQILALSEITGLHLLASLLLFWQNTPGQNMEKLVGAEVAYTHFQIGFDYLFVLSCCLSAFFLALRLTTGSVKLEEDDLNQGSRKTKRI